jgi:hypothetical protein
MVRDARSLLPTFAPLSLLLVRCPGKRVFTRGEVARHNTDEDLWVIINGRVYDLTVWLNFHPGGRDPLIQVCAALLLLCCVAFSGACANRLRARTPQSYSMRLAIQWRHVRA